MGAVEWIFNAIKTGISAVLNFIKFLFEWDDIKRTKNVMHLVTKLYLENQVVELKDEIQGAKFKFDNHIDAFGQKVSAWAGIDWASMGDIAQKPAGSSTSDPMSGQTAASQLFSNHFKDNAGSLTVKGDTPST